MDIKETIQAKQYIRWLISGVVDFRVLMGAVEEKLIFGSAQLKVLE